MNVPVTEDTFVAYELVHVSATCQRGPIQSVILLTASTVRIEPAQLKLDASGTGSEIVVPALAEGCTTCTGCDTSVPATRLASSLPEVETAKVAVATSTWKSKAEINIGRKRGRIAIEQYDSSELGEAR